MKKRKSLETLTDAEKAMIPEHIEKFKRLERATGEADWLTFEKGITHLYKNLKLQPPVVVRAQSPKSVTLTAGIADALLGDAPTSDAPKFIARAVDSLYEHIPEAMRPAIVRGVLEATKGNVTPDVVDPENLKRAVNDATNSAVYGQFWAAWPAFSTFCRKELGLDLGKKEEAIEEAYSSSMMAVCWYVPHESFVVAGNRPQVLKLTDDGRLHCVDGPAMMFADGFGAYCVRGVEVPPEWIVNRASVDPGLAFTHPNMEQRRALVEILGWKKILEKLPTKVLQKDEFGELFEVKLPESTKPEKFVRVLCGTGREFCLAVAPTTKTAHQGVADSYGLSILTYKPGART